MEGAMRQENRDPCPPECCDMRGMLSFMILWLLSKRPMYGQELATEIGKRRGTKPNPGTIYPALKELEKRISKSQEYLDKLNELSSYREE